MNTNEQKLNKKLLKKYISYLSNKICEIMKDFDCDSVDEIVPWIRKPSMIWRDIQEDFLKSNEDLEILEKEIDWILKQENHDIIMKCKEKSERRKIIDDLTNNEIFIKIDNLFLLTEKDSGIIIGRAIENNEKYKFAVIQPWASEHVELFF